MKKGVGENTGKSKKKKKGKNQQPCCPVLITALSISQVLQISKKDFHDFSIILLIEKRLNNPLAYG